MADEVAALDAAPAIGRYQVFYPPGGIILLVDTATGKTWSHPGVLGVPAQAWAAVGYQGNAPEAP